MSLCLTLNYKSCNGKTNKINMSCKNEVAAMMKEEQKKNLEKIVTIFLWFRLFYSFNVFLFLFFLL